MDFTVLVGKSPRLVTTAYLSSHFARAPVASRLPIPLNGRFRFRCETACFGSRSWMMLDL